MGVVQEEANKQGMDLFHVSDLGEEVQASMALLLRTMHLANAIA